MHCLLLGLLHNGNSLHFHLVRRLTDPVYKAGLRVSFATDRPDESTDPLVDGLNLDVIWNCLKNGGGVGVDVSHLHALHVALMQPEVRRVHHFVARRQSHRLEWKLFLLWLLVVGFEFCHRELLFYILRSFRLAGYFLLGLRFDF